MKKFQPNALDKRDKMIKVKKPSFFKRVFSVITYPFRMTWRGIVSGARALAKSPVTTYRSIVRFRDSFLAKVQYLESESAKWKTAFKIIKMPYSLLISMGFSPQLAMSLIIGGSVAGGGVVVNETLLSEKSFTRGDSGTYNWEESISDAPTEYSDETNTLKVTLGSTAIGSVTIQNMSVGTVYANSALPTGQTNPVLIGGVPASEGFTETFIEIGTLYIENWRCDKLKLTNSEVHTLTISYMASDGQSISPVPSSTPRMRVISGGNRASDMLSDGGTFDMVYVTAPTSGVNGKISELTLKNLYSKGGECLLRNLLVGELILTRSEVGLGNGFATKEFVVEDSVKYRVFNNIDNLEVSISPPATQ